MKEILFCPLQSRSRSSAASSAPAKPRLLRHLLKAEHGLKIAVIENEFSDAGIDTQLLGDEPVQVMTLSNGCVCCTIHTDLTKALYLLLERLDSGEIAFDRLVIECTGLADPAPVAQTFFIDEELRERYILDGIITLVDAAHAEHAPDPDHRPGADRFRRPPAGEQARSGGRSRPSLR